MAWRNRRQAMGTPNNWERHPIKFQKTPFEEGWGGVGWGGVGWGGDKEASN